MPEGYVVPAVWEFKEQEGKFGGMNKPTSGARKEKALPKGEFPIQLYSLGTPNGIKCTMLLEELVDMKGIEYDAHKIDIFDLDQFSTGFCQVNPNSKIPAMYDYDYSPAVRVFESCSILKYIAEKYNAFIPKDHALKTECYNWLFFQHGTGPYIGNFGHFYKYAPINIEYGINRFTMEVKRELDVLDKHLADKVWICGDEYSIADMAIWPWIYCIKHFYKAQQFVQLDSYINLMAWYKRVEDRPATARGLRVNGFGDNALPNVYGSVTKMDATATSA